MGVRIDLYAVDEARFLSLSEQPVAYLLRYYESHGVNREQGLHFYDRQRDGHFSTKPGQGIWLLLGGNPMQRVSADQLDADPYLQCSGRSVLLGDNELALNVFLSCFASCPSIEFIKEITADHRRWWVGSFLNYLKNEAKLAKADYETVAAMFLRLLGPYKSGNDFIGVPQRPEPDEFPIVPDEIMDGMCVWNVDEVKALLKSVHIALGNETAKFHAPQGDLGIIPETDDEWDKWAHSLLTQMLRFEDLKFEKLKAVGFIG